MNLPSGRWIVTADARRATLFTCRSVPGGNLHFNQDSTIENEAENSHEHHRPTLMGGSERRSGVGHASAAAAPHSVSQGHTAEEEHERFARQVSTWLKHAVKGGPVSVFAAPRFLGLLRAKLGDANPNITLHEAELANLRAGELADHPAILAALKT